MVKGVFGVRRSAFVAGLLALISTGGGPTEAQQAVLGALGRHLWGMTDDEVARTRPMTAAELSEQLVEGHDRRRFVQLAIVLAACCHPVSEAQSEAVAQYSDALGIGGPELTVLAELQTEQAEEVTADFVRFYDDYIPQLSEPSVRRGDGGAQAEAEALVARVDELAECPEGSLGHAFLEFYRRNRLRLPTVQSPQPAYYVSHDMNHVIAGYEPTGPGEIAFGAFKVAVRDDDANWMAFMANVLIHEVGLMKHGTSSQFVPYGGEIYPGHGGQGALRLPGAADLLAEAFVRGGACTSDVTQIDHLALVHLPLDEVRRRFNVTPLATPAS